MQIAARAFSTTSRPIRSTKFVDALLRETREPVWRLLTALNTPRSVDLPAALSRHGVSADQFRRWRPLVVESNISAAVGPHPHPLPSWLVLYLVAFKIRTHDHAFPTALDLTYAHLPTAPMSVQGPLLILTLLGLARFNLLIPMRRVVDTFLVTNLDHPQLYFNLLLQAIACTPTRTIEAANAVVALLRRMDAQQLKLTHATYDALLNDRFVTLQLTKYLRERMTREGTVPTAEHLEAYLRVFSKNGAIHKAHDYLQAIHARPSKSPPMDPAEDPLHRANTLFLTAQDDRASAFTFLRTLLASPDPADPLPAPPTPPTPSPTTKYSKIPLTPRLTHLPSSKSPRTPKPPIPHPHPASKPDIYTSTAALSLAARDHTVPAPALLALFNRFQSQSQLHPALAPTTTTHTVLIRGLLARKSKLALPAWERFYGSGLPVDREALGVGMQVLTRAGHPHWAWALLEEFAGPTSSPAGKMRHGRRPVQITVITLNDWLVALNRIARPDIVFRVWDGMQALYGVHPDARTLSLLLQAARLARRLDDSFGGAMVRLGLELRNPFTSPQDTDTATTRETHTAILSTLLGPPHLPSPHPYRSALWHATLPSTHATLIFQQALFGAAPSPHKLRMVEPPAYALRSGREEGAGMGLMVGLPRWRGERVGSGWVFPGWGVLLRRRGLSPSLHATHKDEDEEGSQYETRYPAIAPTNENCFNYILLLGLTGRTREIALVLAWMREVGIRPGRGTLGAALVLWGEVCARGVLVERWTRAAPSHNPQPQQGEDKEKENRRSRPEQDEYKKLETWLAEWVGEWRMPGPRALAVWTRNLARLREGGREVGEGEEGIEEAEKVGDEEAAAAGEAEGEGEGGEVGVEVGGEVGKG